MYLRPIVKEREEKSVPRRPESIYLGHLSGTGYYDYFDALPLLSPGTPLQMRREPDNRYDCYAVAVDHGPHKLGYIPRTENHVIARLMDAGVAMQLKVRDLSHDPGYFGGGLEVEIFVLPQPDGRVPRTGGENTQNADC